MTNVCRDDVEHFLYEEAELLDNWELEKWLELFLPDAKYLVPSLDASGLSEQESLYLIMDDFRRLSSRIHQYLGQTVWAENPFSRTRRLITNVRIRPDQGGDVGVTANFAVYRYHQEKADTYVGRYQYLLAPTGESFRIRRKTCTLDMDVLRPQGKLSILL